MYERVVQMDGQEKSYKLQIDRKTAVYPGDRFEDTEIDTNFGPRGPHAELQGDIVNLPGDQLEFAR